MWKVTLIFCGTNFCVAICFHSLSWMHWLAMHHQCAFEPWLRSSQSFSVLQSPWKKKFDSCDRHGTFLIFRDCERNIIVCLLTDTQAFVSSQNWPPSQSPSLIQRTFREKFGYFTVFLVYKYPMAVDGHVSPHKLMASWYFGQQCCTWCACTPGECRTYGCTSSVTGKDFTSFFLAT